MTFAMVNQDLNCYECSRIIPGGLNGLAAHFRNFHYINLSRNRGDSSITCGQNGCLKSYVEFRYLRRHIKRDHFPRDQEIEEFNTSFNDTVDDQVMDIGNEYCNDVTGGEQNISNESDELDLKKNAIGMIGKFHGHGSMTGSLIKNVVENCESLMVNLRDSLEKKVLRKLSQSANIEKSIINEVKQIFEIDSPFDGLKTYDQQMKALIQNFKYIEPEEIPLGLRIDTRKDRNSCNYEPENVKESFQYVPVIKVLELVLCNKEIRSVIETEQPSPAGILGSFIDGAHFQNHNFFQRYPHALRLKLYYDEFEIVNPLGSKTCIHKIGAFYYQIDNLPCHMNSELSSIHVLLLCCHEDIKKYGFHRVLEPFLSDLKKLEKEEGVELWFDNQPFVLRASISSFCGDGLAVHEVFNLLGPSANFFCRLCTYSREDLHARTLNLGEPRTEQKFNEDLNFLAESNYSAAAMTATGIKGDCCLNKSKYFHNARNKIFDAMHDFLCGVCPMVVKLVLQQFICKEKEPKFDCKWLNNEISLFNYGYLEQTNKPSANFTKEMLNKKENTLSQKAMQMWTLVRVLPFILTEKVDSENDYMQIILVLLRIMDIAFAPKIPKCDLPYLHALIEDFAWLLAEKFKDINWINKIHHMFHYADCIFWSGPLIYHWCMRFEAQHGEFKLRAQNVHNFKNPPKTIIRISQCNQSSRWGAGDVKVNQIRKISGNEKLVSCMLSHQHIIDLGLLEDDFVYNAKSIYFNGIEFRPGFFVVLETEYENEDGLVVFGRVEEIVAVNDKIYLLSTVCQTINFDIDLHAYHIKLNHESEVIQFIEVKSLKFYKPFCYWTKSGSANLYISTRHIIV